ncbi:MAG TPA: cell division ATP-binding protein FtsE [Patescibacteria group bacterium]|nr:cell division ATP-binding protein FtsE [Patescibacteria group bacterium]
MIRFDAVTKKFKDDFSALEGINLQINAGEFVSIVGASGAGKSTLLKLIYAEENPSSGTVFFKDKPLDSIKRRKLPFHRRNIGTVFQDFKLLPQKTAYENVAYALEACGAPKSEILEDVPQILDIVGLGEKMYKFPRELSGGEQQRVAMARALIHKPLVIVADEPTGNLDPVSSAEVLDLLLKINNLGTTVLLASHDRDIINKAARRVITLEKGRIVSDEAVGEYKIIQTDSQGKTSEIIENSEIK